MVSFIMGGFAIAFVVMEAGDMGLGWWSDDPEKRNLPEMDPWQPGRLGVIIGMMLFHNGEEIPRGLGYAYRCWTRDAAVYMPIPFNLACRLVRAIYMRMRFPTWDTKEFSLDELVAGRIEVAYLEGARHGRDALRVARDERIQCENLLYRMAELTEQLEERHTGVPTKAPTTPRGV